MRRLIAAILISASAVFVVATSQGASASDPAAEADFVGRINSLRASQGAGSLQVHSVLTAKAQAWAAHMAATGCLCHSNLTDGVNVGWRKLGENVGRGPSVASLQSAFIGSPEHLANMLDRRFQWVGIGVAYGGGQMWVAEVFMDGDGPPVPSGNPVGRLDNAVRGPGVIGVQGWALDPDLTRPIQVHIYVDGRANKATTASTIRNDIGAAVSRATAAGTATRPTSQSDRATIRSVRTQSMSTTGRGTRSSDAPSCATRRSVRWMWRGRVRPARECPVGRSVVTCRHRSVSTSTSTATSSRR